MLTTDFLTAGIDKHYASLEREGNLCPIRGSNLHACPRQVASLIEGVEPRELTARSQRIFELGHSRHASLAAAMASIAKAKGWTLECERTIWIPTALSEAEANAVMDKAIEDYLIEDLGDDNDAIPLSLRSNPPLSGTESVLHIRARADFVFINQETSEAAIVEFKTKNGYAFKKLNESGPDPSHITQIHGQADGLSREGLKVMSLIVLYENKDTSELKPLPVAGEDGLQVYWSDKKRTEYTLKLWASGQLASAEPMHAMRAIEAGDTKLPWQCNYCPVGPERGGCIPPGFALVNKAPPGEIPKWHITS